MTSEGTRRSQTRWRLTTLAKGNGNGKGKGKSKRQEAKPDKQDTECCVCRKKGHLVGDCIKTKTVNEVDADAAKEFVFTIPSTSAPSGFESPLLRSHTDQIDS